ncbi:hypothetical protein G9A89_002537 [Geosiphon pyriformis]|nr:hypothetical protein G9A89_002537 [Geosiphon pyriformis]
MLDALLQSSLSDWLLIGSLVFGGCCSNVVALELLVGNAPKSGNLITLAQFLFVALEGLRHHLVLTPGSLVPRLKPRLVPLFHWIMLVVMFFTVSVLNNIALGFKITVPLHIIFRSGGLIVSMIMGWAFMHKRYTATQVSAVVLVTVGVFSATFFTSNSNGKAANSASTADYIIGISLLSIALILSCVMGLYQEQTYATYGSDWREGLFYTHFLALPLFSIFYNDILSQMKHFNNSKPIQLGSIINLIHEKTNLIPEEIRPVLSYYTVPISWLYLILNVLTQYVCVSGVHRLNSISTALTLNLVLNLRKFTSLMISVWYFDNEFTLGMMIGSFLVFVGTFLYSVGSARSKNPFGLKAKVTESKKSD